MKISSFTLRLACLSIIAICLQPATRVDAQGRPPAPGKPAVSPPPPPSPPPSRASQPAPKSQGLHVRLSGNIGFTSFKASDSFKAILGTSSGVIYGGGAGLLFGPKLFVDVDIDRFSDKGERVFIGANNERFGLGIPVKVTTMPVEASVGWRARMVEEEDDPLERRPSRFAVTAFLGVGAGVLKYKETSDFAESGDNVNKTFTSYHVMGGAEFPIAGGFGLTADLRYRWVPNALGDAGVSQAFNEKDLGGFGVRLKATFTF